MYSGPPSPIFDVPEFPTLRRIKPLPKRRRTTGPSEEQHITNFSEISNPISSQSHPAPTPASSQPTEPLIPPGIAEELLSRCDNLSTRMALQNYYLPILGNVQNFLSSGVPPVTGDVSNNATAAAAALVAVAAVGRNGTLPVPPLVDLDSMEFGVHFAAAAAAAAATGLPMGGLNSTDMGTVAGIGNVDTSSAGASLLHVTADLTPVVEYGSSLDGREEGSREDSDGLVRQPGNAKKRKVPANLGGSLRGLGDAGGEESPPSPYLDEDCSDSFPGIDEGFRSTTLNHSKEREGDRDDSTPPPIFPPPFPGQLSSLLQKKGKLTAATLAGLQHKEQLKARKRQLANIMGALSHGDTLALDQALSFKYPFTDQNGEPLRIRKSKRRIVRISRSMNILMERPDRKNRHPDAVPFPESEFSFKYPSTTAQRLIKTKEEITMLRKRFRVELERQSCRAPKPTLAISDGIKPMGKSGQVKSDRQERERDRTTKDARQKKAKSSTSLRDQALDLVDSESGIPVTAFGMEAGGKAKSKTGKKKKRSALANASNPHHLRNYVPSRLPNSGPPTDGSQGGANNIWPLPVRFLAAGIPDKKSKSNRRAVSSTPLIQVTQPAEEWICAFCEYNLFYGDEGAYQKAVRSRKKILRRRRRAAERAAAAAGGANTITKTPVASPPFGDEEYNGTDTAVNVGIDEGIAPPQRNGRTKEAPDRKAPIE